MRIGGSARSFPSEFGVLVDVDFHAKAVKQSHVCIFWSRKHAPHASPDGPSPPIAALPLIDSPPFEYPPARAGVYFSTNSCVGRLGYDLEGKCKEIVARQKARRGGGGAKAGRSSPSARGSAARCATGNSSRSSAPNYTSESVIEDIYGGVTAQQAGTGSRDRATRASRRSASSVSGKIPTRDSRGADAEAVGLAKYHHKTNDLVGLCALAEGGKKSCGVNVPRPRNDGVYSPFLRWYVCPHPPVLFILRFVKLGFALPNAPFWH